MPAMLENISLQPKVRDVLVSLVQAQRTTHAYLFSGPKGSGKLEVARAFAQALVCANKGCGVCDDCTKAAAHTHPDVQLIEPKGAQGYLIDQIRAVVLDATRAPVCGQRKVFIIAHAEKLGTSGANAFLKTLEEPSSRVVFILLTENDALVLPTIVSRCQKIPFGKVPVNTLVSHLVETTACTSSLAHIAISTCAGNRELERALCTSQDLQLLRHTLLTTLGELENASSWSVIKQSECLLGGDESVLEAFEQKQLQELQVAKDFLSRGAYKQLEEEQKRALAVKKRELFGFRCSVIETWLHDVLSLLAGFPQAVINTDSLFSLEQTALHTTQARVVQACECVRRTEKAMDYNVSLQLCIETVLLEIRETLYDPYHTC